MFLVEPDRVEAVRSNQKVHELKTKYVPTAVGASGSVVAIGGEVSTFTCCAVNSLIVGCM